MNTFRAQMSLQVVAILQDLPRQIPILTTVIYHEVNP